MFPSFLTDSYFARLMSRMDTMEQTQSDDIAALGTRIDATESSIGAAAGRLNDLEGLADGHNTRLATMELWYDDKAAGVDKLNASGFSVLSILGISVIGADNCKRIADKVDTLIDRLVARGIIEAS